MEHYRITRQQFRNFLSILAFYTVVIFFSYMQTLFNPMLIIGIIISLAVVLLIIKYPFWGLTFYLILIFIRPGETMGIPFATRAIALACLISWVFNVLFTKTFSPVKKISIYVFLFFAAITLSVANAYWLSQFYDTWLIVIRILILYILIVNIVTTPKRFKIISIILICLTCYITLLGINEYYSGQALDQDFRTSGVTGGMFDSANDFAQILVMFIPFLISIILHAKRAWQKLFAICSTLVSLMALVFTFSRGGFVGLIAITISIILSSRNKIFATILLIIVIAMIFPLVPNSFIERMRGISNYGEDESVEGRFDAWKGGYRMFKSNPITGIGAGCFASASFDYGMSVDRVAHNTFVTVISELGVVGAIPYFMIFLSAFKICKKYRYCFMNSDNPHAWPYIFIWALPISLVGFIVTGVFLTSTYYPSFFIILSLCASYEIICDKYMLDEKGNIVLTNR